jgi:hypothetical protein
MKEDFPVPEEFKTYSNALFKKQSINDKEFIDLCQLAINLVDTNWGMRQGLAYHVAAALQYENIRQNKLLDELASEFSTLELPDEQIADSEDAVREKWNYVKGLVSKANN